MFNKQHIFSKNIFLRQYIYIDINFSTFLNSDLAKAFDCWYDLRVRDRELERKRERVRDIDRKREKNFKKVKNSNRVKK